MPNHCLMRVVALVLSGLAGPTHGEGARTDPPLADVGSPVPSSFERLLAREAPDPALLALWRAGHEFELDGRFLDAAGRFERVIAALPERSDPYWRTARNYWLFGDDLPLEEKPERIRYFEQAKEWAARGLEQDPDCASCMLWEFASMGRLATSRGVLSAMGSVGKMAELLERGIALQPTYRDSANNSVLGNLYLAGSKFYRILPDSIWVKWLTGVRGDKDRALGYSRKAADLSSGRVDYQVELGVVLLCVGATQEDPSRTRDGYRILARAARMTPHDRRDELAAEHAGMLSAHPERACGYTSQGQIEIDGSGP